MTYLFNRLGIKKEGCSSLLDIIILPCFLWDTMHFSFFYLSWQVLDNVCCFWMPHMNKVWQCFFDVLYSKTVAVKLQ